MVWLDAFSNRYLSPELCPFLWDLSEKCFFAKISPLFAYTGIKYCIEFGVSINTHKVWNDHVFRGFHDPHEESSRLFKMLLGFVDRVSFSDYWNKILRYALFKAFNVEYGTPHLIPASLIDLFPVSKDNYKMKNLYDVLKEHDVNFMKKEPKLNIEEGLVLKSIPKLLKHYDALFIKLNSLDRLGHKYGPLSDIVRRRVRYFDEKLRGLVNELVEDVTLILMSDHGMVPVTNKIDLVSFLESKGFSFGRDYVGFIGATYASFWFKNEKYRDKIKENLSAVKFGKFLILDDKVNLGMDDIGPEYGEEIFAINEHYVIFPEFYHLRRPPKGMHGYSFSKYDMPIFFMRSDVSISRNRDKINFIDIMPTILRLFDLIVPSYVEGISLI